jgi:hypothetical protein
MSNEQSPKTDSPDRRLGDQLKREALADRPEFSSGLHDRIMTEIVARGNSPAIDDLLSLARKRKPLLRAIQLAAIAAAILIAIFAIDELRRGGDTSDVVPRIVAPGNVATVNPPPRAELSFDDLDHTAGIALRLVVDQLPIEVPADDWGLPAVN